MHLALYNDVVVFDQATKIAYAISWVHVGEEVRGERRGRLCVWEGSRQGRGEGQKAVDV